MTKILPGFFFFLVASVCQSGWATEMGYLGCDDSIVSNERTVSAGLLETGCEHVCNWIQVGPEHRGAVIDTCEGLLLKFAKRNCCLAALQTINRCVGSQGCPLGRTALSQENPCLGLSWLPDPLTLQCVFQTDGNWPRDWCRIPRSRTEIIMGFLSSVHIFQYTLGPGV